MKTLSFVLTNQKQRSTAAWKLRVARTSCYLCPHLCSSQRCCRVEHRGGVDVARRVDLRRPLQLREFGVATPSAGVTAGASPLRCVTEPQRQHDPSVRPRCVVTSSFICTLISGRTFFSDLATSLHLLPTSECKHHCFLLLALEKHTCDFKKIQSHLLLLQLEVELFELCCCGVYY